MPIRGPGRAPSAAGAAFAAIALWLGIGLPAGAAVVPAGFADAEVIGGLTQPVSFAFAPNGDIWIAEKQGAVKIARGGGILLAGTLPVVTIDEMGISGLALDPAFADNGHIWIHRSVGGPDRQRVSRFTVVNDLLTDEVVVLEFPVLEWFHHAGCLQFDADGLLYLSTGDDNQRSATSQNTFSLQGKILRINPDGSGAAGNPFADGVSGDPRIWALGLRNPYRFSINRETGTVYIADVGDAGWEELNLGLPGANYGWAPVEGFNPPGQPGYTYPVFAYEHTNPSGHSIIGGDHAGPGDLVPEYEGHYFFGDQAAQELHRLVLDPSNTPVLHEIWATGVDHPVEIRFGPDGALYYLAFFAGSLRKVEFVGGSNRPPQAAGVALPSSGPAPLAVLLDGTASSDPDMDPLTYAWDAGDGATGTGATFAHVYAQGVYHARLTADDGQGGTGVSPDIRVVSGNRAPTATISQPADGATYDAGDTIQYAGGGLDPEDGPLYCTALTWTVTFRHLGHTHPHIGPIQGNCGGSFVIPTTGETSAETSYEVRLDAVDNGTPLGYAGALSRSASVTIHPNTAGITLATAPDPGLTLTLDDALVTAPRTVTGVVNFERRIGAPSPQAGPGGRTYTFSSWSDGGAPQHTIVTPAADTTYTATFACNVLAEVQNLAVAPAAGGQVTLSWDPVDDLCAVTGPARYRVYAAATARPASPPGLFPADPAFGLRGTTASESLTFLPSPGDAFFLVVAAGTDGQDGPAGHYGD